MKIKTVLVIAAALSLLATTAESDGISGNVIGRDVMGGISFNKSSGSPPSGCASTGIFNLGNVCNDIYFIGALR
jgi:hypothetical protein